MVQCCIWHRHLALSTPQEPHVSSEDVDNNRHISIAQPGGTQIGERLRGNTMSWEGLWEGLWEGEFQRFSEVFRGFERFSEVFQRSSQSPSQSAIFLLELRALLPLIVLPLKTPAHWQGGKGWRGDQRGEMWDMFDLEATYSGTGGIPFQECSFDRWAQWALCSFTELCWENSAFLSLPRNSRCPSSPTQMRKQNTSRIPSLDFSTNAWSQLEFSRWVLAVSSSSSGLPNQSWYRSEFMSGRACCHVYAEHHQK